MSNKVKKPVKQAGKKKFNPLPIVAMAVVAVALVVVFIIPKKDQSKLSSNGSANQTQSISNEASVKEADDKDTAIPATINENGDVVIPVSDITESATFYDLDLNGTAMGLFAVKASDGTIRTAFNTCQVCNGSPYAFFTQDGDTFQCQNCGNIYSVDMIGKERGGCNPVPITADEKTVTDTEIIIPAKLVEDNAGRFDNWKQF